MTVKVIKSDPPESTEILAEAIVRISAAFDALQKSGLNRKAIVVLIQAETRIAARDINAVLDAMARLKVWYCR